VVLDALGHCLDWSVGWRIGSPGALFGLGCWLAWCIGCLEALFGLDVALLAC